MISKKDLFKHPNYLLTRYQIEIFRALEKYRKENNLTQKALAKKLGVSTSYINQILKGKFNFTLKKLIELGLAIGNIPKLEFLSIEDFLQEEKIKKQNRIIAKLPTESKILIKIPTVSRVSELASTGTFSNEDVVIEDQWGYQSLN